MPGVWSFVGPVYLVEVVLLVSCQSCSSSEDCWRNPRLGVLFPKSISGRSQMVFPLQRKQYQNRKTLTVALSITCLEIRSRNEEAINSTQNRIYSLKVFLLAIFRGLRFRVFIFTTTEQALDSGESTSLALMWPVSSNSSFDAMLVKFVVGSIPYFERFSSRHSNCLFPQKPTFPNSNLTMKVNEDHYVHVQPLNSHLFIHSFTN